jgi:hypothetical protein
MSDEKSDKNGRDMNKKTVFDRQIARKEADIQKLATFAMEDRQILQKVFDGLRVKTETIRYNSFRIVHLISESHPQKLYDHWDFFVQLLKSKNTFHKHDAIHILANLTQIDKENKFDAIFHLFYDLLNHRSVVVVCHLILVSGKIALFKPQYRQQIVNYLLDLDNIAPQIQHLGLMSAYAIEALKDCYPELENKSQVQKFMEKQLKSDSPKARKLAKAFLSEFANKAIQ